MLSRSDAYINDLVAAFSRQVQGIELQGNPQLQGIVKPVINV